MTDKVEKTSIEYFNEYMKTFVLEIKETFPEFNEIIDGYYTDLLTSETCNDDKYVKRFMRKLKDFKTQISGKDASMFKGELCVLKNVDFEKIFASEILTDNTREKIWEYLQTLYVIGESIISDSERVKNLVKNFQRLKTNNLEDADCETEEDREILDMLKNIAEQNQNTDSEPLSPEMFENGVIGKLAKELSEEINVESLGLNIDENTSADQMFSNLISGDNPMKFMNLLQTVGQKIQDKVSAEGIDQNDLINEATQMMGSLSGGGNSMFDALLKRAGGAAAAGGAAGGGGLGNMNQAQMNNPHGSGNATRDRLRKKLEKRKNQK